MKNYEQIISTLLAKIAGLEKVVIQQARELQIWKNAWIKTAVIAPSHHQVMGYQNHHAHLPCAKTAKIKVVVNQAIRGKHLRTQKYNLDKSVYYEVCDNIAVGIAREKQIKGWSRKKWKDLYQSIC